MNRITKTSGLLALVILCACTEAAKEQATAVVINAAAGIGTMLVCNQLEILAAHNKGDSVTCALQDEKKAGE